MLIVLPSWVGDAVMATPALRLLRRSMPGAYFGALARPGVDRVLAGLEDGAGRAVIDEFHLHHPTGVLGPKFAAAKVRPRRYGSALLLTNSFSTALAARVAGIPRRFGSDRDGRGPLLTGRFRAPKARDQGRTGSGVGPSYAVVPAVSYYWHAARAYLDPETPPLEAPPLDHPTRAQLDLPDRERLSLALTERDLAEAAEVRASIDMGPDETGAGEAFALLNPGGNNPAKRWPADRYAALARHLTDRGLRVLINGSPDEAELCRDIAERASVGERVSVLPDHGSTLGALKTLAADASLMVTNDTGPRHIAVAFGTPVVSLFGPTDPRWTTVPTAPLPDGSPSETILVAEADLPPGTIANDVPERCRVDRIELGAVIAAADALLDAAAQRG